MRVSELDADGRAFRDSVRRMVSTKIEPVIEASPDAPLSKAEMSQLFREISSTGYFGTRVAEADGGSGLPHILAGVFLELVPSFLGVACVSQEATIYRINLSASSRLRNEYVPRLVQGELLAGTAVSEPDTGSDSNHPKVRFTVRGDQVEVSGTKLWTTNGSVADVLVLVGIDTTSREVVRLLVDTRETEVQATDIPMIGLRRGHLCEVEVKGLVPAANLMTDGVEQARATLARSWTMNRASVGLLALSIARRAVEYAVQYAGVREQFGRKIGSFQLVQALIADAATSVEAGRLLCYRALSALDDGQESTLLASMAKLFGTEAAIQAVIKAQQVAGTFGVSAESPFDEWYRDVRMFAFPDGTSQIQQLIIGRELLRISAF